MIMRYHSDYEFLSEMVRQMQGLIAENKGNGDSLREDVHKIFTSASSDTKLGVAEVTCRSCDGDEGVLRVLDPTESMASVEVDPDLAPSRVDFFLTRPAGEGKVETRLLGTAKYPDSEKKWSVRFQTDRYAESPFDPLLLHAEIRDFRGYLVAVAQSHAIT